MRSKTAIDHAVPAGNATMVGVLARLYLPHRQGSAYRDRADALVGAFAGEIGRNFFPLASFINAADLRCRRRVQIVIVGEPRRGRYPGAAGRAAARARCPICCSPSSAPARACPRAIPRMARARRKRRTAAPRRHCLCLPGHDLLAAPSPIPSALEPSSIMSEISNSADQRTIGVDTPDRPPHLARARRRPRRRQLGQARGGAGDAAAARRQGPARRLFLLRLRALRAAAGARSAASSIARSGMPCWRSPMAAPSPMARSPPRLGGTARDVGGACGRNPIPIIIPCHRVMGANGAHGGYSGGAGRRDQAGPARP